ncbi:hypothetical protein HPP92_013062 [Vanilla planifolia]|uniref:Apyrase n=1 Tax=Vanilla planifolia TaxID=51239 RepID=A0A835QSA5_VANPL|nr:hypothetical protein HPP92_013062 [Vanilla planifolia]
MGGIVARVGDCPIEGLQCSNLVASSVVGLSPTLGEADPFVGEGADEGIYAWVAANYALGSLGKDAEDTYGIVELGGASAQITFVSGEQSPSEFLHA